MYEEYEKWEGYRRKIRFIFLVFGIAVLSISTILFSPRGILIGFSFLFPLLSYGIMKRKFPSVFSSEEWEKTVADMGLAPPRPESEHFWVENLSLDGQSKPYRTLRILVEGDYRNHHVTISEFEYRSEEIGDVYHINYDVEFKNPTAIIIYMRKLWFSSERFLISRYEIGCPRIDEMRDIRVGDPEFDRKFLLKGNRENKIKVILDSSIRNKIMNTSQGRPTVEIGYTSSELRRLKEDSNIARYKEAKSLEVVKLNPWRFRLIVDTMNDIVEKIEANTTSI